MLRGELFVTTKVACCPTLRCNAFCVDSSNSVSVHDPAAQLNHSLRLLGLECPPSHAFDRSASCGFVDLALLHFPCARFEDTVRAYKTLVEARRRGLARAIGVSNFNAALLAKLLDAVDGAGAGGAATATSSPLARVDSLTVGTYGSKATGTRSVATPGIARCPGGGSGPNFTAGRDSPLIT